MNREQWTAELFATDSYAIKVANVMIGTVFKPADGNGWIAQGIEGKPAQRKRYSSPEHSARKMWGTAASAAIIKALPAEGRAPVVRTVIKEPDTPAGSKSGTARLPLTKALCSTIAQYNGQMTPAQVHHELLAGKTIYTNFSRYRLEA